MATLEQLLGITREMDPASARRQALAVWWGWTPAHLPALLRQAAVAYLKPPPPFGGLYGRPLASPRETSSSSSSSSFWASQSNDAAPRGGGTIMTTRDGVTRARRFSFGEDD